MHFTMYDADIKAFYKGVVVAEIISFVAEDGKAQFLFLQFDKDNYENRGGDSKKQMEPLDVIIARAGCPTLELKQVQITRTDYFPKIEFVTCDDIVKEETFYATYPLEIS